MMLKIKSRAWHKKFNIFNIIINIVISKFSLLARCWWLMPVILATQEAEIRKTEV
jgi:hypothetical protein